MLTAMTKTRAATRKSRYVAGLSVAGLLIAGCDSTVGDKSGGPGPAVALVLANNDGGTDGIPAVSHFADRVAALSGGRITVRIQSEWQGGGNEARVIKDVAAGEADLGWSGTRAFDTMGVTAFQPLHAPFLIGTYPAEAAVVRDPVAGRMLASLGTLGLTGLGLTADELRLPAATGKPLLTPADFHGRRFGTVNSAVQSDALRSLGANPVTLTAFRSPDIDGLAAVETMWWTYQNNNQYGHLPYVTGNAALWPRTVALFANTARLKRLDTTARDWLRQAADDAVAWSATHAADRVAAEVRSVCGSGARIATATPAQLAALRAAAEPVYDAIGADPARAATLSTLKELVRTAPADAGPPLPPGCAYGSGGNATAPTSAPTLSRPGRPGALPQGSYRFELTVDDLLAHGASRNDAENNAGILTWTLRAGRWHLDQKFAIPGLDRPGAYPTCDGFYDVKGDTASFTTVTEVANGSCSPPSWSARWTVHGKTLNWTDVSVPDIAYGWAGKPWQRIS
jgi:TRAP-type C4-dicarboxylate transport system substrate-binding protein